MGAVDFSLHCLEQVLRCGGNVVAVFTPERRYARLNSDYADLGLLAQAHNIPVHRIRRLNDPENVSILRELRPDVIFVFGPSQIVSAEVLSIPTLGCIGTHPALLPKNRGRHPLIWALVEGLNESGLTFFYLDQGTDSGDILWQQPFPITLEDDAGTLYERVKLLAGEGIAEFLPQLEQGVASRMPQDHAKATYWRKRTEADGEINWSGSAMQAYNLIRALTHPYVGAHTFLSDHRVLVWRNGLISDPAWHGAGLNSTPGEVMKCNDGRIAVRTGDGLLELIDWEIEGDARLAPGVRLGRISE